MATENPEQSPSEVSELPRSPLSPASLIDLYFHPRKYFSDASNLSHRSPLAISAIIMGIAGAKGRIDKKIIQAELGYANNSWNDVSSWLLTSWVAYWIAVVLAGLIGAVFLWYLGGWWYKKRLQWSGAKDATSSLARRLYTMQELVSTGPTVLLLLVQTVLFSNYREAWLADEHWSSSFAVFAFWSCWTSYTAAITASSASKAKARVWFLVLPVLLYIVAIGIVGTLYGLFANAA